MYRISRFLLDRSDEVARELSGGGDARLLVRARRSLLLAAAELYSRTPQEKLIYLQIKNYIISWVYRQYFVEKTIEPLRNFF